MKGGVWRGLGEDERESVEGVGRGCEGECGGDWERMKGGVWRGLGKDERESVEGVGRGCEGECGGGWERDGIVIGAERGDY